MSGRAFDSRFMFSWPQSQVSVMGAEQAAAHSSKKVRVVPTRSLQAGLAALIAFDPTCGDLIAGTGGLRKVRVGRGGSGKRGGARVIYYFHGSESLPILIFAVFTKNEKANLSDTEKNNLAKLTQAIKARAK